MPSLKAPGKRLRLRSKRRPKEDSTDLDGDLKKAKDQSTSTDLPLVASEESSCSSQSDDSVSSG